MFKIALVMFREILEISMVLGIITVATRSIQNATLYITAGIMSGIIAAGLLGFFLSTIDGSFSGYGDELFDVAIIFLTVIVVSATAIWVRSFASTMTSKIGALSEKMERGVTPKLMLTIVVATTVFREGTEIVLYMYSLTTHFTLSPTDYILGFAAGIIMGITVATSIYYGLSRVTIKYIFKISFILLALIAASLAAEAAGKLASIGVVGICNEPLWDSSWLISDTSITGHVLKILVGYNSKPYGIQLIFYTGTILLIFICAKLGEREKNVKAIT